MFLLDSSSKGDMEWQSGVHSNFCESFSECPINEV
jgi:hypothetical protein